MKLKLARATPRTLTLTRLNSAKNERYCCHNFMVFAFWIRLNQNLKQIFRYARLAAFTALSFTSHFAFAGSQFVQTDQVRADLLAYAPNGVNANQTFWVGLKLTHQPEWHTYWKNPGDSGLPTQLAWDLPKGFQAKELLWPTPQKLYVSNLTNYGFEGTALLVTPISVPAGALLTGSSIEVGLHASWLICKQECVPQEGDFRIKIPIKSSSAIDSSDFISVIEHQAIELPKSNQVLELKGQRLVGQFRGIPKEFLTAPYTVFPELSELISDPRPGAEPKAADRLNSSSMKLDFELHPMRSTQPSELGLLLVFQTPQGAKAFHTNFKIKGTWPKIPSIQSPPSPGASPGQLLQTNEAELNNNPLVTALTPDTSKNQSPSINRDLNIFVSYPFLAAVLGALLGGMILNLMPCVLPILAIKVLSLATHSQDTFIYRRNSIGYALGVMFCFLLLGGLVVGLKTIGLELGWGFQLQSPVAVAGLSFLFLLIALNLLGVFQIHLVIPNKILMIQSNDPGIDGFLSGLLSVLVAAPCTAPFMGASLGWAVTAANWQGLLIFACLGLGMALPILAISFVPSLGRLLPRPGAWMNTMRVFLAFPMLFTVTWLLWVYGQQLGLNSMALLIVALITFSALIFCSKLSGSSKTFATVFFLVLLVCEFAFGRSLEQTVTTTQAIPSSVTSNNNSTLTTPKNLVWELWSPQLVEQTLAQGRPVFVDFTAAWCITCQVNESTTLQNETIKSLLLTKNVRLLRADWTKPNAQIASTLANLGRNGIPVYLILAPGQKQTMLSELLDVQELAKALNQLRTPEGY